jgi:hypothetical protein
VKLNTSSRELSRTPKPKGKRKMTSRIIECTISRDSVVSQVGAFLYSIGVVHDNEHIKNIQFGDLIGTGETMPIKIFITPPESKEVRLIRLNGESS